MAYALKTDEVNIIPKKKRGVPFERYFGEMELPEWDKERRIEMANKLEEMMLYFFALVELYQDDLEDAIDSIVELLALKYRDVLSEYIDIDEYLQDYTDQFAVQMMETTEDDLENPWMLSDDRAVFDAENEANFTAEYINYVKAVKAGKKNKVWRAFSDNRTRKTHKAINGKVVGIFDLFEVGNALMRFPKDTLYGNYPEEVVNCRCTATYF